MDVLPPEIWLDISEYCNQQTRIRLALSCHYLFQVLKSSFTKTKCKRLDFMQEALRLGTRAYLDELGVSPSWRDLLRSGNLTLVQQQHSQSPLSKDLLEADKCLLLRTAVVSGSVALVEWLLQTFSIKTHRVEECNNYAFRHAARKGRLTMLQWLVKHVGRCDLKDVAAEAYVYAAKEGHLDMMDWLQEKFLDRGGCGLCEKQFRQLIEFTVQHNKPKVLQKLRDLNSYYFTEYGLDWYMRPAYHPRFSLHAKLMLTMCKKNYLECLQVFWPYSQCEKLNVSDFVKIAVTLGNLHILEYLLRHPYARFEPWTKETLAELAVKHNQTHIQEWVELHWPVKDAS